MMTDAQRRYSHARRDFKAFHVDKAQELLAAVDAVYDEAERKVKEIQQTMEALRPVWAQGFSSDSQAAQAHGAALAQLWGILGVDNQTAAVERLNMFRLAAGMTDD